MDTDSLMVRKPSTLPRLNGPEKALVSVNSITGLSKSLSVVGMLIFTIGCSGPKTDSFSSNESNSPGANITSWVQIEPLTSSQYSIRFAGCSPDGRYVDFLDESASEDADQEIYIIDLQASQPKPKCITCNNKEIKSKRTGLQISNWPKAIKLGVGYSGRSSWSPDSTRIKIRYKHYNNSMHFVMELDSGSTEYIGTSVNLAMVKPGPNWLWKNNGKHTIMEVRGPAKDYFLSMPPIFPREGVYIYGDRKLWKKWLPDETSLEEDPKSALVVEGKTKDSPEIQLSKKVSLTWVSKNRRYVCIQEGNWANRDTVIWDVKKDRFHKFGVKNLRFVGWDKYHMIALKDKTLVRIILDR